MTDRKPTADPARKLPCGCVTCVCSDPDRCHGCGAKESDACREARIHGTGWKHEHARVYHPHYGEVPAALVPAPDLAEIERLTTALREIAASRSDATGMRAIARAALVACIDYGVSIHDHHYSEGRVICPSPSTPETKDDHR